MATDNKPAAANAAPTDEQLTAARTAGAADAQAAAAKQSAEAGALAQKAERDRVAGILGHAEAAGRRSLAEHLAFKTDSTVEAAAALMAASAKEAAAAPVDRLAAAMAREGNPKIGADGDPAEKPKVTAPNAANVFAFRRECVAKVRAAGK